MSIITKVNKKKKKKRFQTLLINMFFGLKNENKVSVLFPNLFKYVRCQVLFFGTNALQNMHPENIKSV